jgi:hypothetical protein
MAVAVLGGPAIAQWLGTVFCWAAVGGPVSCLGDDDVVCGATMEQMSQAVFSASPLAAFGGCISRPSKLSSVSRIEGVTSSRVSVCNRSRIEPVELRE